ncbi:O-antigen ligase family protein [Paraferrimonas haliotis]|uniref:O-antigen ligase-related domain-containing protein n=1 Tax=Paraferrimonas haliotis TaxID=2013866 RepID=A0AA37TU91_9GAMM|nr:O-antigen ligase family protein [Paraferrimonas haliotis]GLS84597.1 hypothetical protein GCM10007894_25740 [Paraferrimonas haliotis]
MNTLLSLWVSEDCRSYSFSQKLAIVIFTAISVQVLRIASPDFSAVNYHEFGVDMLVEDTSGSGAGKYLFWFSLFALSLFLCAQFPKTVSQFCLSQKPLLILVIFGVISVAWALAPVISFKRSVMQIILLVTVFSAVIFIKDIRQIFLILYRLCFILLFINLMSIPAGVAFDLNGAFRGALTHKNVMGQYAALSLYMGAAVYYFCGHTINKLGLVFYSALWAALLLLSISKTSIALFVLVPMLIVGLDYIGQSLRLQVGTVLFLAIAGISLFIAFGTAWFGLSIQPFLQLFVEDTSLTGRDFIWGFMLDEIKESWLIGYGLGSFWGIGFDSPNIRYGEGFIVFLHQAHNGYIDLLAQLGVIGLLAYIGCLAQFSKHVSGFQFSQRKLFYICWILMLFSLTNNITESSIIRGLHSIWVIQLLVIAIALRAHKEYRQTTYGTAN